MEGVEGATCGKQAYIDSMVLRDRDANTAWTTQSDGTLEERVYYCQNWRGDVSVLLTDAGTMLEWVKYLAYGREYGHPGGDVDGNGSTNVDDATALINLISVSGYHVRADVDLDGDADTDDVGYFSSGTMGWGVLSMVGNRFGYAGYHHASELAGTKWDARNRMLDSVTGVWNRRDPLGYVDGMNLYQYVRGMAIVAVDPMGLACATCDPIRRNPIIPLVPREDRVQPPPPPPPPPPPTPYEECTAQCDNETPENSVDRAWCYHDCRIEHDGENCGGIFFDQDLIPPPAPCAGSLDCAACCLDNAWGEALGCYIDVRALQCGCRRRGEPDCDQVGLETFRQCRFAVFDNYLDCLKGCPKLVAWAGQE